MFPFPSSVKKRFASHVSGWLRKWLENLKLSSNFVDFKQAINPAGDCFNEEWFFAMNIEGISHRETSNFLERATSATSNKGISERVTSAFLQRVTSDFLQRATSATSNKWFFATSNFYKE